MEKGLWSVAFSSQQTGSFGMGVITFSDGKVQGGDSGYYYSGSYSINPDGSMVANVKVKKFNQMMQSIFGNLDEFNLGLSGKITGTTGSFAGQMKENPALSLGLSLLKLE